MIINSTIAYGIFNKSISFVSVFQSETHKGMKTLFLGLLWFQLILAALVLTLVFRLVAKSETSFEILGDAFGVIILNDFDDYAG